MGGMATAREAPSSAPFGAPDHHYSQLCAGESVLVVDDDPGVRRVVARIVGELGCVVAEADSAEAAHRRLARTPFGLVVCDVRLPDDSGLDLANDLLTGPGDMAVLLISGEDDPRFARAALELGTYGYVIKPFRAAELRIAVLNALRRRELELESAARNRALEKIVSHRTAELERSAEQLRDSREETIRRLSMAVEYRDADTGQHVERMSRYCGLLAEKTGLDGGVMRTASPLHDVGKVAIPDSILLKPGAFTPGERLEMRKHAELGFRILTGSGNAMLELGATIALTHHEHLDGSGYPRGLRGTAIPLPGRVTAVADVFDALTSSRIYRPAFGVDQALDSIWSGRGRQFDPEVVDVFFDSLEALLQIRSSI